MLRSRHVKREQLLHAEHAASATYGWENKYHWVRRLPREWSLRLGLAACLVTSAVAVDPLPLFLQPFPGFTA